MNLTLRTAKRILTDAEEVMNAAAMCWNSIYYEQMIKKRPPGVIIARSAQRELASRKRWLARAIADLRVSMKGFRP